MLSMVVYYENMSNKFPDWTFGDLSACTAKMNTMTTNEFAAIVSAPIAILNEGIKHDYSNCNLIALRTWLNSKGNTSLEDQ